MTRAANDTGEHCTRTAALDAGWRYAAKHPGETLVLRHTGCEGQRWQLAGHDLSLGLAVREYKRERETLVRGAVALWSDGLVKRFDVGELAGAPSRTGTD